MVFRRRRDGARRPAHAARLGTGNSKTGAWPPESHVTFHHRSKGCGSSTGSELDGRIWSERPELTCQEQFSLFSR